MDTAVPSRRETCLVLLSSQSRGAASARCGWLAGRGSVAAMNSAELLDLLGSIEQAAIDGDVVQALLLCQKLGGDADSAELRDWARHELKGYPGTVYLPDYRRVKAQLFGDGAAPGQRISDVPIPMDAPPLDVQAGVGEGTSVAVVHIRTRGAIWGEALQVGTREHGRSAPVDQRR